MTRPYYGNMTEVDYYRRSSRSIPLAISHSTRDEARSYPLGRRGSGGSPAPDPESDRNGSQPRRRIAVAVSFLRQAFHLHRACTNSRLVCLQCGRCRKRKIKCSGDPGNGTGCNNCKSAGADMGQCQFLRVQCEVTHFYSITS